MDPNSILPESDGNADDQDLNGFLDDSVISEIPAKADSGNGLQQTLSEPTGGDGWGGDSDDLKLENDAGEGWGGGSEDLILDSGALPQGTAATTASAETLQPSAEIPSGAQASSGPHEPAKQALESPPNEASAAAEPPDTKAHVKPKKKAKASDSDDAKKKKVVKKKKPVGEASPLGPGASLAAKEHPPGIEQRPEAPREGLGFPASHGTVVSPQGLSAPCPAFTRLSCSPRFFEESMSNSTMPRDPESNLGD
eukprot:scaffold105029_cov44-Prasinocladus_malaysianus.AAC.1